MYAPALVAFLPLNDGNQIGWVPLGPGDSYAPRYYDDNWQPRYLTRTNIVPAQLINFGIPGAVTVVPVDAWGRAIDPRSIRRIDGGVLASVRPTLDPLTLTPLRNAVIHSAWGRGKIDLPPGIAKKLYDTRVFVGGDIRESKFRKDLAKSMRVERVSDQARNQKFKVKDERESQQADQGRKQEIEKVSAEAAKANKEAPGQARKPEQQQRKETRAQEPTRQPTQQKAQRKTQQQPQGERVGKPAKPQAQGEQPTKHEAKPQSQGASKPQHKQDSPAQPGGQGQAGGKGKGKP
jgi:hypothetical protein